MSPAGGGWICLEEMGTQGWGVGLSRELGMCMFGGGHGVGRYIQRDLPCDLFHDVCDYIPPPPRGQTPVKTLPTSLASSNKYERFFNWA